MLLTLRYLGLKPGGTKSAATEATVRVIELGGEGVSIIISGQLYVTAVAWNRFIIHCVSRWDGDLKS